MSAIINMKSVPKFDLSAKEKKYIREVKKHINNALFHDPKTNDLMILDSINIGKKYLNDLIKLNAIELDEDNFPIKQPIIFKYI